MDFWLQPKNTTLHISLLKWQQEVLTSVVHGIYNLNRHTIIAITRCCQCSYGLSCRFTTILTHVKRKHWGGVKDQSRKKYLSFDSSIYLQGTKCFQACLDHRSYIRINRSLSIFQLQREEKYVLTNYIISSVCSSKMVASKH